MMKIDKIKTSSIAEEMEIESGDILISVNDVEINDMLDYGYNTLGNNLEMLIQKTNGEIWSILIEKDDDEEIGLIFTECVEDSAKSCSNRCIFCFIDQMPKNMRKTLYFKDDDTRMSFLYGNYVTLTNITDEEINKIIKYRLSPINVSVHTTNPELRKFMMGNEKAGDIMNRLRKLTDNEIEINSQIVLCRNINDGNELEKTINDLFGLGQFMNSLSVVPVGITKFRKNLYKLSSYDRESSIEVVDTIKKHQHMMLQSYGKRKIYPADEFYLMSGIELPLYAEYEDFPQIENGVGMLTSFIYEAKEYMNKLGNVSDITKECSIATGSLAFPYIKSIAEMLSGKFQNLQIHVYEVENDFFGNTVGTTGLLTGTDIIRQLSDKKLGDTLYISETMLKAEEKVLLDDITTDMICRELNTKVVPVENNGADFIEKLIR